MAEFSRLGDRVHWTPVNKVLIVGSRECKGVAFIITY